MGTIITDTAANYSMDAAVIQQMEYEQRPREVRCEICDEHDQGSQRILELEGWELSPNGEFCWRHRD